MKAKWMIVVMAILGSLSLLICTHAAAQPELDQPPPSAIYPKVQIVDVEQDIINAAPETPAMTPIEERRHHRLKSLIRLRENFRNRVLSSARGL